KCVSHTLTLAPVETPVIREFVRERIRVLALRLQLQRHAVLATDFAEADCVRLSGRICENKVCLTWCLIGACSGVDWCAGIRAESWPRIDPCRSFATVPLAASQIAFPPSTLPMSANAELVRRSYPRLASPSKSTKRNLTILFARATSLF